MKILALETSGVQPVPPPCARTGRCWPRALQNSGLTHSRTLMPMAGIMLKNCGASRWRRWR